MLNAVLSRPGDFEPSNTIDAEMASALAEAVSRLGDDELDELEDDLNFFAFAGIPSKRILEVLAKVKPLTGDWLALYKLDADIDLPARL